MTFSFPKDYPEKPLNLDIDRTPNVNNKLRAKLIASMRAIAQRYSSKHISSLEACLTGLLGGEVYNPENDDNNMTGSVSEVFMKPSVLLAEDAEVFGVEQDDQRLGPRTSVMSMPPRRCGAVFSPTGVSADLLSGSPRFNWSID